MPLANPPLSLYLHMPWCVRKCPYCDFNSHESNVIPEQDYLRALLKDVAAESARHGDREIRTVFIGGGTPSLMTPAFYRALFDALRGQFRFAKDVEVTLEANPGTVDSGYFEGYKEAGINRLSIGVQSFDDQQLRNLGRIHSGAAAVKAVALARRAGFDNINLDIMHGLPRQDQRQALDDLEQAIALAPQHLSWYELTIEPNTVFYRSPPTQPDGDSMADTEEAGFALLAQYGYQRYEVSAFARDGMQCRHNVNYWQFGDYLGLGAGAHGKVTNADSGQIVRYQKTRRPQDYMSENGTAPRQVTAIEGADRLLEASLNTLRLIDGVPVDMLSRHTGMDKSAMMAQLQPLVERGLLRPLEQQLRCTPLGVQHLNSVLDSIATQIMV